MAEQKQGAMSAGPGKPSRKQRAIDIANRTAFRLNRDAEILSKADAKRLKLKGELAQAQALMEDAKEKLAAANE